MTKATHLTKLSSDVCNVKLIKAVKKLFGNKVSVYEKFLDKFENERCLPFKENRLFLQDNFVLSERRFRKLQIKNEYDAIMKEPLVDGVVRKVETIEVTHLPHIQDDKKDDQSYDCI